jgi:hypothetical protein
LFRGTIHTLWQPDVGPFGDGCSGDASPLEPVFSRIGI